MMRLALSYLVAVLVTAGFAGAARADETAPPLTAAQIVDKNVAARGGLEAWRKVQTMAWIGHLESANSQATGAPFVLEQKRPNKTRFELANLDEKTMRVFDGSQGWTVHLGRGGAPDVKPYTSREIEFAKEAQGIDGPLIDYQAKGIAVELEGTDSVDGQPAYRLGVTLASGERHHVWIDAKSFLDVKYDRTSYNASGTAGTVSIQWRDYKAVDGLEIPTTLVIGAGSGKTPDRMVIDRIAVNPPLPDALFEKPGAMPRGRRPPMPRPAAAAVPAPAAGPAG